MNKLSKEDHIELDGFIATLTQESEIVDSKLAGVQDKIGDLNNAIQAYNNTLKNVRDFRDGLVQKMKDHWESKTEDWQEGDEGETYQGWIDAWEEAELEPMELVVIEQNMPEHTDVLSDLPPSCE